jgi:hypothetical protein
MAADTQSGIRKSILISAAYLPFFAVSGIEWLQRRLIVVPDRRTRQAVPPFAQRFDCLRQPD